MCIGRLCASARIRAALRVWLCHESASAFLDFFRAKGDFDIDDQPPIRRIHRADLASVSRDSPVRDCKAESRSVVPGPV